jgi:hypothetical protein
MDRPYTDPALAASQTELVRILASTTEVEELLGKIAQSGIDASLKAWLLSSDHDMLETAASLVAKWGSEDPNTGVGLPETG